MKLFRPIALALALSTPLGAYAADASEPKEAGTATGSNTRFSNFSEELLDGLWEGRLEMRLPLSPASSNKPADPEAMDIRIELSGTKARVYLRPQSDWQEVMVGQFVALRIFTNATVVGVHGEGPDEGAWIESWAINLSALDDDTMLAEWTRAVTNLKAPKETDTHLPAFSMAATGRLRRVK